MTYSVVFENVTKKYKLYRNNIEKLGALLIPEGYGKDFYAVQNISFTAEKGDIIGVIGMNGAGKSTLSNLITGITPETSGEITINGQASLIAIASGLNNQLTGRENIEYKCLMLGFRHKEINKMMPEIIEFAELGQFIDQPVKNYSSGMKSRLGFAISVNIDPDILVIDEALSVGDQSFADKSLAKMNEFKAKGKTIFFVSHSIKQVNDFCEKVIWLEAGEIKEYGPKEEVIPKYLDFVKEYKALTHEEQNKLKQEIAKRRSELRIDPKDQNVLKDNIRKKRKRNKKQLKIWLIMFLIIALVGVGIAYLYPSFEKALYKPVLDNPLPTITKDRPVFSTLIEPRKDIRYINVSVANIREEASLDSSISLVANFGQALEILDTDYDDNSEIEWLKIRDIVSNEEGWISSKLLAFLEEDNANRGGRDLVSNMDNLLNSDPTIRELIDLLDNGEAITNNSVTPIQSANKYIGFSMLIDSVTSLDLLNVLGEPDLLEQYTYLYHGETYDYTFHLLENGIVESLSVVTYKN